MKYASKIIGLPVVSFDTGEKFERVEDIVYDVATSTATALLVDAEGIFSQANIITFPSIQSIGDDAIIVPTKDVEISADDRPDILMSIETDATLRGLIVMTEDGKDLGTVADIAINETTGRIEGYLTSGGIFADLYHGKPYVPAPETIKIGEDVLFVPSSTAQTMQDQAGGLKEVAATVTEGVKNLAGTVQEKAVEIRDNAYDTAQAVKENLTSDETKAKLSDAKDMVQEKVAEATDKVKELAGAAKDKTEEVASAASDKTLELRLQQVIGKTSDRTILAKNDDVILEKGAMITHAAAEQAESEGMIEALIASATDEPIAA